MKTSAHARRVIDAILATGLTHRQARAAMGRNGSRRSPSLWSTSFRDLGALLRLATSGAAPWSATMACVDAATKGTWIKVHFDGIDADLSRLIAAIVAYPGNRRAAITAWVHMVGKAKAAGVVAELRELVASSDHAQPPPPPVKPSSPKAPVATAAKVAPTKPGKLGSYTQRLRTMREEGKRAKDKPAFNWDDWGPMR